MIRKPLPDIALRLRHIQEKFFLKYAKGTGAMTKHGSIQAMADTAGVPHSTLRHWLQGRGEPTSGNLRQLAEGIGVSATWLLTGKGKWCRGRAMRVVCPPK